MARVGIEPTTPRFSVVRSTYFPPSRLLLPNRMSMRKFGYTSKRIIPGLSADLPVDTGGFRRLWATKDHPVAQSTAGSSGYRLYLPPARSHTTHRAIAPTG